MRFLSRDELPHRFGGCGKAKTVRPDRERMEKHHASNRLLSNGTSNTEINIVRKDLSDYIYI